MSVRNIIAVLTLICMVVGCQSKQTPSGETTAGSQPSGQSTSIDVDIAGGKVTPTNAEFEAKVGETIELRVNSDADDELHVHAVPEHTFQVKPGHNQSFTFTVDVPGRVEIEVHNLDRTVAIIHVRQ